MPTEILSTDHIPKDVLEAMERIRKAGHSVWIVGGALRDHLLEHEPKDWDLATDAAPERVAALFARVAPIGLQHGTIQVLTPIRGIEVTTVPSRGAEGLLADLARRDFTVNAMAWSYPEADFLDPHGGRQDLQRGLLRGVGNPVLRFREDPLRTLRAGRFVSTHGFRPDRETFAALRQEAVGLPRVAAERIREEWVRLLMGHEVVEAVDCMQRGGVIRETLPEMGSRTGTGGLGDDPGSALLHAARTAQCSPARVRVRLAAFFHDLKRSCSGGAQGPVSRGCPTDPERSSRAAEELLIRWKTSARLGRSVVSLVARQLTAASCNWSDAELRRAMSRVGRGLLGDWIDLGEAHARALSGLPWDIPVEWLILRERILDQQETGFPMDIGELAVNGADVMRILSIPPGPNVGRVLRDLHERVIEDPSMNRQNFLMDFLLKSYHK
jgi:tRNA nucleotidyltransferase/poly(A) polymerase